MVKTVAKVSFHELRVRVPWCTLVTAVTTAKPRPVPALLEVKKGSKILVLSSSGIMGPLLATAKDTWSSSAVRRKMMWVAPASTALATKFDRAPTKAELLPKMAMAPCGASVSSSTWLLLTTAATLFSVALMSVVASSSPTVMSLERAKSKMSLTWASKASRRLISFS